MNGLKITYSPRNQANFNKDAILDLIRFKPEGISRAELARQMNLSRSAVTAIISDLLAAEIVHEVERGPVTGGRRPILLELNPGLGYIVGIDLGATHLSIVLADFTARVIHEAEQPFDICQAPADCLDLVEQAVNRLLHEAGLSLREVLAFGVGVPGPVSEDGSTVIVPPIMPGWDRFPIQAELVRRWRRPVALNNDAELGALGEWAYGAGRHECNLVYIKVGSGVGAGLLLDNRIYRGAGGTAGEIGHITIQNQGPLCSCGNRGCLEALAGGQAIAQQARYAVRSGQRTQLAALDPVEKITARDVSAAARRGDLVAQQILAEAGMYLGIATASLINLLNPGIVIVGGGVAQSGDLFLEPIRQAVRERSLQAAARVVRIVSTVLGRRSTGMGGVVQAQSLVIRQLTHSDHSTNQ